MDIEVDLSLVDWCTSSYVKLFQRPKGDCPRCKYFGIGHPYEHQDLKEPDPDS